MNNKLQNPLQVLQEKTRSGWSGCLEIESPQDLSICWNVYLLQGKIQYISSAAGQQARLEYLWQISNLGGKCPHLKFQQESSEYLQLHDALTQKQLPDKDIKKLLYRFIREGLIHILSLEQIQIRLVPTRRITKALISFTLEQLTPKLEPQIKFWKQINSHIHSPFSRLYLDQKQALQFYKVWKAKYNTPELGAISQNHKLSSFVSLFVAKDCLYQIAIKAHTEVHLIAKLLTQSIIDQLITVFPFKELSPEEIAQKQQPTKAKPRATPGKTASIGKPDPANASSSLIVCVDDSKTVQKQVKMTLEAAGYKVLGILDPSLALKQLAQYQPAVIFL
ncbi:MAG: DUF4388 domain-containing protein, partial [Cyanobacteria bacterium J06558_2]